MSLVAIHTIFSPVEAEIMRSRLDAAGIAAVLFDAGISSLIGSGLGGVRLMVDSDDANDAKALLGL